jgi:ligand-binding sensor domain-containing protein
MEAKKLSHGIRLSSSPGEFALATLRGGLVIIDSQGKLKQIFDKTSGLQDDNVKYVFEDSRGNLWLALSEGIAKIEYASPFTIYGQRSNLPGSVFSVTRHNNGLYAGTSGGQGALL